MRAVFILSLAAVLIGFAVIVAFLGASYWNPASIGTPSHAGAVSHGQPDQCTNVALNARARSQVTEAVLLQEGDFVRGTFEVNGGFGRVDIFLRIVSPRGLDILASPRADHYDFTFPAQERGAYTFTFDNRFSMFTSKGIGLYYCIDRAVVPTPAYQ
jgi:hypothetical protein